MKSVLLFFIILLFGLIGYEIKNKYKKQKQILENLLLFLEFYKSNICVFKNDIVCIINEFKLINKNKNAIYENLFIKTDNIYQFNVELIKKYITNERINQYILNYFSTIGTQNQAYENDRLDNVMRIIKTDIISCGDEIKTKGDLYFKIILAAGVVLSIILW